MMHHGGAGRGMVGAVAVDLTRREAIGASAAGALALAGWGAVPGWARKRPPGLARGAAFPGGVAAGAPKQSGVSLWTRLEGVHGPARLGVQIAADPDFKHTVLYTHATSAPDADDTAHIRVQDHRLRPGTNYWYRFVTADGGSEAGRFRTLRPRDSRDPIRIGFWTCQAWTEGHFSAHPHLAAEDDLDLVICLGDYIYEYGGAANGGRADPIGTAQTLDQYRAKYRLYRTDPGLRALHAAYAMHYLWDDHEVVNNYWRDGAAGATNFAARKAAGYRAWFEHQPMPRIGGPASTRIYRAVRAAAPVDLFFIDDRQYRDQQPCNDSILSPCADAQKPGRTFLGSEQKAWLQSGLRRSDATWKVLVNGDMMMGLDQPAPGTPKFVDDWDGYQAERAELVSSWLRDGVHNIVVMTGDDHDNYAGVVTTTGHSDGVTGAVEFVVPSMTSQNTSELLGGSDAAGIVSETDTELVNSHLAYVDQRHHGYCVMTASPDEMRVDFRHVSTVRQPQAPVSSARSYRVQPGHPVLERVA